MAEETFEKLAEQVMSLNLSDQAAAIASAPPPPEPEDLDELIEQIVSEDLSTRFFGVQNLRRRINEDSEASYAKLLNTKAFSVIVESLGNSQQPDMQYECAWILTNLLSNRQQEKTDLLAKGGGLCQPLVKLLANSADRTREQACWALANVVGECAEWRDQALANGLLPALTTLWDSKPCTGILDATSLLLVNLFRDREPRVSFETARTLLPYMLSLLDHPHSALAPHVVWAMSYLIEESEPRIQLLLREDVLSRLRHFLVSKDDNLLIPTLRVFGNISSTMTLLPSCVLAEGVLAKMRPILDDPDAKIRRQVLFFVSNVSDGPDSNLQLIVESGYLSRVGTILLEADELEKREAFWIVPNFVITRGSKFKHAIINDCLEGFLEVLTLNDAELTHCILLTVRELLISSLHHKEWNLNFDALKKRIEHCGGLKKIELVQNMGDQELGKMSYQIIDDFFWHNGETYLANQEETGGDDVGAMDNASVEKDDLVSPASAAGLDQEQLVQPAPVQD